MGYKFNYIKNNELFDRLKYLQISKNEIEYLERSEDEFKSVGHLVKNVDKIIDLGCGLGRSSIYLKNMLDMDDTIFYLCDFSGEEYDKGPCSNNPCGQHIGGNIPYNDLSLTERFSKLNNLTNINIIDLSNDNMSKLEEVDVVYSFHCVGYHWDITESFKENNLENVISNDGVMIFGVRKNKNIHTRETDKELVTPQKVGSFTLVETIKGGLLQDYVIYRRI